MMRIKASATNCYAYNEVGDTHAIIVFISARLKETIQK